MTREYQEWQARRLPYHILAPDYMLDLMLAEEEVMTPERLAHAFRVSVPWMYSRRVLRRSHRSIRLRFTEEGMTRCVETFASEETSGQWSCISAMTNKERSDTNGIAVFFSYKARG